MLTITSTRASLLAPAFALCILLCLACAPLVAFSSEFEEKNRTIEALLIHEYGSENPFLKATETASALIALTQRYARKRPRKKKDVLLATFVQTSLLPRFDRSASALLRALIEENGEKQKSLKAFLQLALEVQEVIKNPTLISTFKKDAQTPPHATNAKRFVMVNPAIIGTIGKAIGGLVIAGFGIVAIKKILEALTAKNHEALAALAEDQRQLYKLNKKAFDALTTPREVNVAIPIIPVRQGIFARFQEGLSTFVKKLGNVIKRLRRAVATQEKQELLEIQEQYERITNPSPLLAAARKAQENRAQTKKPWGKRKILSSD